MDDDKVQQSVQQAPAPNYMVAAQELAAQRDLLSDRAINLALLIASRDARIAELEKELADLKREHLVRAIK